MTSALEEGLYTTTEAYNFLKNLLGIPKNALIKKDFFLQFFKNENGYWRIRYPEETIKTLFKEADIPGYNQDYYQHKQLGNKSECSKIYVAVINLKNQFIGQLQTA